jgi:hypothetical protein
VTRQAATVVALAAVAFAALVLSVGSWITFWRRLREWRRDRAAADASREAG